MTPEVDLLNIGCGFNKIDDHWNIDIDPKCNPDQIVDIEITPWPFENNFFKSINASFVLQQVGKDNLVFLNILKEMYRVSQDQAQWVITVPDHKSNMFVDDYKNVRYITPTMLQTFDQRYNYEFYKNSKNHSYSYGILNNIDVETIDVNFKMVDYWEDQSKKGMIGSAQLRTNLNTLWNVAHSTTMFLRVHKPGRFENLNELSL